MRENQIATLASASHTFDYRFWAVGCNVSHASPGAPTRCGRVVWDELVPEEHVSSLLAMGKALMSYSPGGSGGVRYFIMESCTLTRCSQRSSTSTRERCRTKMPSSTSTRNLSRRNEMKLKSSFTTMDLLHTSALCFISSSFDSYTMRLGLCES